jgi:hypothetical protein
MVQKTAAIKRISNKQKRKQKNARSKKETILGHAHYKTNVSARIYIFEH